MSIEGAIRKAIEGGLGNGRQITERLPQIIWEKFGGEIFLLPDFWQSLGKCMGWEQEVCKLCHNGWTYMRRQKEGRHGRHGRTDQLQTFFNSLRP
jgi:hypothetical protein